jgi:large subunit ribosomal protein L13
MKGNLQRRYTMQRLHLYPDEEVDPEVQKRITSIVRQTRPVPQRLDHIPGEQLKEFPQLAMFPKDYVIPELKPMTPKPSKT